MGKALGIYNRLYKPIESWVAPATAPTLGDMAGICSYIHACFDWRWKGMMGALILDLMLYKLLFVVGGKLVSNSYQSMLDAIEDKWDIASFPEIDAICTFTMIKAE